jgi:hypothetical protein
MLTMTIKELITQGYGFKSSYSSMGCYDPFIKEYTGTYMHTYSPLITLSELYFQAEYMIIDFMEESSYFKYLLHDMKDYFVSGESMSRINMVINNLIDKLSYANYYVTYNRAANSYKDILPYNSRKKLINIILRMKAIMQTERMKNDAIL